MWYQFIKKAYRELKKPLITLHKTKGLYGNPVFDITAERDLSSSLGAGSKVFGPGHYTSQNPHVTSGYAGRFTRLEVLPAGTRILEADKIPKEHYERIINKLIELGILDKRYFSMPTKNYIKLDDIKREIPGIFGYMLNSILLSLGYDAIQYPTFTQWNIPRLENESDEEYEKRSETIKAAGDNILILNRALLSAPRLFEKSRFAPESLTSQDIDKLQTEMYVSEFEIIKSIGKEILFFTGPFENYLKIYSDDEIKQMVNSFSEDDLNLFFASNSKYLSLFSDEEIKKLLDPVSICHLLIKKSRILRVFSKEELKQKILSCPSMEIVHY